MERTHLLKGKSNWFFFLTLSGSVRSNKKATGKGGKNKQLPELQSRGLTLTNWLCPIMCKNTLMWYERRHLRAVNRQKPGQKKLPNGTFFWKYAYVSVMANRLRFIIRRYTEELHFWKWGVLCKLCTDYCCLEYSASAYMHAIRGCLYYFF